jgi:uncharacterized protein
MLVIEISKIPAEGMVIDEALVPGDVHLEGEDTFRLDGGRLRARVERGDDDSVHVRGHLDARLQVECNRCLEPVLLDVDEELDLFYLPRRGGAQDEEEDEVELSDRDMVVAFYRGDRLDVGDVVREQLFLSIPMKRLCREDCRGRCRTCGRSRNTDAPCACPEVDEADPRMAPLRKLFDKGSS